MNYLKTIIFVTALLSAFACKEVEIEKPVNDGVAYIDLISPLGKPDNGIIPGTEVLIQGEHLGSIDSIMVGGAKAQILSKKLFAVKFLLPEGDWLQETLNKFRLCIFKNGASEPIYDVDCWVYVPLKDARITTYTPVSNVGLGEKMIFTGKNLKKIKTVLFGNVALDSSKFISRADTKIELKVPTSTDFAIGLNTIELKYSWDDGQRNQNTMLNSEFTVVLPNITKIDLPASPLIGAEIKLNGEYLDKIDSVMIGQVKARLIVKNSTTATVIIMTGDYGANSGDYIVYKDVNIHYGDLGKTILHNMKIDTHPRQNPNPPVVTDIANTEGYYLKKPVTITGSNLNVVTNVFVADIRATILPDRTDNKIEFLIPDDIPYDIPTACNIAVEYDITSPLVVGVRTIKPYYYWKDLKIAAQGADHSIGKFFVPDSGKVYTVEEWLNSGIDQYAKNIINKTSTINPSSTNAINKSLITTEAMYKSVAPYFMLTFSSSTGISFINVSGSIVQYKLFKKADNTSLTTLNMTGTPIVLFRGMGYNGAGGAELAYADSVRNKTLKCINSFNAAASSYKTAMSTSLGYSSSVTTGGKFNQNSVIMFQHVDYDFGKLSSPSSAMLMSYIYKTGYIQITQIENESTDKAIITFDCYWPKRFRQ
ncbi:MAG: hypothetical protein ACOYOV_07465 [Bacteroidales bacterium]